MVEKFGSSLNQQVGINKRTIGGRVLKERNCGIPSILAKPAPTNSMIAFLRLPT